MKTPVTQLQAKGGRGRTQLLGLTLNALSRASYSMGLRVSPDGHMGAAARRLVTAAHSPASHPGPRGPLLSITSGHTGLLTFLQAQRALSPASTSASDSWGHRNQAAQAGSEQLPGFSLSSGGCKPGIKVASGSVGAEGEAVPGLSAGLR